MFQAFQNPRETVIADQVEAYATTIEECVHDQHSASNGGKRRKEQHSPHGHTFHDQSETYLLQVRQACVRLQTIAQHDGSITRNETMPNTEGISDIAVYGNVHG